MTDTADIFAESFKYAGIVVALATGFVGFFATKTWHELTQRGKARSISAKRRLTRGGKWTLFLLVCGAVIGLGAQVADTVRTKRKQREEAAAKTKQEEQERQERERSSRQQTERTRAALAELIFQKNEVERMKVQLLETARNQQLTINLPEITPIAKTNVEEAISQAIRSLPEEFREQAVKRNKEEADRIAMEVKARELSRIMRPRVIRAFSLIREVAASVQGMGLTSITNLGPMPDLGERMVYSRHEPEATLMRLGQFARTNVAQRIEFENGDVWLASLRIGVVESLTETNANLLPRIIIRGRSPLGSIGFDSESLNVKMEPTNLREDSAQAEHRVSTNLVRLFKESRVRAGR